MRRIIGLILGSSLLSACTHCQVASFYKPQPEGDRRLRTYSESPAQVSFTMRDVPVSVAVCGGSYLAPPEDMVTLCISIELDEATSVRFTESNLTVIVGDSASKIARMTSVEYEIFCRVEEGKRTCTSTEVSPIAGPVQKKIVGGVDQYTFDPGFEFRGAKDTLHEGQWFGHRLTGKRRYLIRTMPISVGRGAEFAVRLPQTLLNGHSLTMPPLKFRAVTEEVCRAVPFQ